MRLRVFLGAFIGYAAYYLVRKNLSLAAPGMIEAGLLDKASVGIAGSAISIAYAFSKFIMGSLSDRSDARKFLVVGLILSSLLMIGTGLFPYSHTNPGLNVTVVFILMLAVGWYGMASLRPHHGTLVLAKRAKFQDVGLEHLAHDWQRVARPARHAGCGALRGAGLG